MTGFVPARLMGHFENGQPCIRSHLASQTGPAPAAVLERNLAQAEAELARLGRRLLATAHETRWGRFSDFDLMTQIRHQEERRRGLLVELNAHRRSVA